MNARIIPLDGSPHLTPAIRQYFGDSRGRWEGDTVVVDVTNFLATMNYAMRNIPSAAREEERTAGDGGRSQRASP